MKVEQFFFIVVHVDFVLFQTGHSITAATSSIPSKYQTIVIDNSDKKGFLSKSRRFNAELTQVAREFRATLQKMYTCLMLLYGSWL